VAGAGSLSQAHRISRSDKGAGRSAEEGGDGGSDGGGGNDDDDDDDDEDDDDAVDGDDNSVDDDDNDNDDDDDDDDDDTDDDGCSADDCVSIAPASTALFFCSYSCCSFLRFRFFFCVLVRIFDGSVDAGDVAVVVADNIVVVAVVVSVDGDEDDDADISDGGVTPTAAHTCAIPSALSLSLWSSE
jgi:cobalamin biosynthesis protein CobT